jgi:hypothetical protein
MKLTRQRNEADQRTIIASELTDRGVGQQELPFHLS